MEYCVETSAAPEWLSKLESRREKLTKAGKLGHESGAGAPCNECGPACPGLDLHFWRKVCRNCKCRKDQHLCVEDEFGWAQFEILGQIRSKPAYIKIKALADQPIKLEWVPPNAAPDIVSDYMDTLGCNHIPVAGSDAATKRKQQLEFQVPPHDMDATLCDNLTEFEMGQLQQYVDRLRDNCVGQGSVVRVGGVQKGLVGHIAYPSTENIEPDALVYPVKDILDVLQIAPTEVVNDKVAVRILSSKPLAEAILCDMPSVYQHKLIVFPRPLSPDFGTTQQLSEKCKEKLNNWNLNRDLVQSLIQNGPLYDKILNKLVENNVDLSEDKVLEPIKQFRKDYLNDEAFRKDLDEFMDFLNKIQPPPTTPIKPKDKFKEPFLMSPIPLKNPAQVNIDSPMHQETPMRKIKFQGVSITNDLGIPANACIEKDAILAQIIKSDALQNALQTPPERLGKKQLLLSTTPLVSDFEKEDNLSFPTRKRLDGIGINKQATRSCVDNKPVYDNLFKNLKRRGINYSNCSLLAPIEEFREECDNNPQFQKEITNFVEHLPNNVCICSSEVQPGVQYRPQHISPEHVLQKNKNPDYSGSLSNPQSPFKGNIQASGSSDSGFDSKPPTPNYSTFPGISDGKPSGKDNFIAIDAEAGKFQSVPGLDDMNMYPHVKPSEIHNTSAIPGLDLNSLNLNRPEDQIHDPVAVLKCKECHLDIMSGEVAVKAERASKGTAWHPKCFVCNKCHQLLADLVYFFHEGNVYCGRDLALILKIPRCNACDELIFTKEYTAAEGASFHIKHFCCYQCDTPLAGQQYIPDQKTNMPLCLKCYDEFYASKCQYCKNIIGPTEQGVSWKDIHWHGECFVCAGKNCGKSLIGGRFCVKNEMPFCSPACVKSVL